MRKMPSSRQTKEVFMLLTLIDICGRMLNYIQCERSCVFNDIKIEKKVPVGFLF